MSSYADRLRNLPAGSRLYRQASAWPLESDFLGENGSARIELLAEDISWKGNGSAGVFFLTKAEQVSGVADLRFHFFLAIAVVVVGDQCDNDTAAVAAGEFECVSTVIGFDSSRQHMPSRRWRSVAAS